MTGSTRAALHTSRHRPAPTRVAALPLRAPLRGLRLPLPCPCRSSAAANLAVVQVFRPEHVEETADCLRVLTGSPPQTRPTASRRTSIQRSPHHQRRRRGRGPQQRRRGRQRPRWRRDLWEGVGIPNRREPGVL